MLENALIGAESEPAKEGEDLIAMLQVTGWDRERVAKVCKEEQYEMVRKHIERWGPPRSHDGVKVRMGR